MKNLLETITTNPVQLGELRWDHEPPRVEKLPGGLRVTVPGRADYFQNPAGEDMSNDSAPYLWKMIEGDFVARARVKPAFDHVYDAGAIMVRHDAKTWAKLCFERTDFGTHAVVSVVTRGVSDDSNHPDLETPDAWLQVARVGSVFAMHYSLDGEHWRMVRYFGLDVPAAVKVGIVAQCPSGPGATIDLLHFSIEARTIANLRAGV